jgi:hypothetical protein
MSRFLSNIPGCPDKTSVQCKSFDQRMKDLNYVSQEEGAKTDLFEAAICFLKGVRLSPEDKEIIQRYTERMSERSSYMNFLQDGLREEEDNECVRKEEFVAYEKKEETSIESHNADPELIFN